MKHFPAPSLLIIFFASPALSMPVVIKYIEGPELKLDIPPSATINMVKKALEAQQIIQGLQEVPVDAQRLAFKGIVLDDNKTLKDYSIQENDVLSFFSRQRFPGS